MSRVCYPVTEEMLDAALDVLKPGEIRPGHQRNMVRKMIGAALENMPCFRAEIDAKALTFVLGPELKNGEVLWSVIG